MMKLKIFFVFILLITISSIEAIPNKLDKRTTDFGQCDPRIPTLGVVPDPFDLVAYKELDLNLTGNIAADLNQDSKIFVTIVYPSWAYDYGFSGDVCSLIQCPHPANTDFFMQLRVTLKDLPTGYMIVVPIFSNYGENYQNPSICAMAKEK